MTINEVNLVCEVMRLRGALMTASAFTTDQLIKPDIETALKNNKEFLIKNNYIKNDTSNDKWKDPEQIKLLQDRDLKRKGNTV